MKIDLYLKDIGSEFAQEINAWGGEWQGDWGNWSPSQGKIKPSKNQIIYRKEKNNSWLVYNKTTKKVFKTDNEAIKQLKQGKTKKIAKLLK